MYNAKDLCLDTDLTLLSYGQTINHDFTMSEVLNGGLWYVIHGDGFYKCVPLFNCDKIISSDKKDKVLDDNQCLITLGEEYTIIQCVSDDTGGIHYHTVTLHCFTPVTSLTVLDELVVCCIVFDEYLNTLNNVSVNVIVDDMVVSQVVTDNDGIARFTMKETGTVQFGYGSILSNSVVIV